MTIVDRYLLRRFLSVIVATFAVLFGIYVVFELLDRVDTFGSVARQRQQLFVQVLADYYVPRLFWFFDLTCGGLTMLAAVLTVCGFRRHQEQVALTTAGIPPSRCFRVVLVASVLMMIPAVLNREVVLPRYQLVLMQDINDMNGDSASRRTTSMMDYARIQFQGKGCDPNTKEIFHLTLEFPKRCLPDGGNQLVAGSARFETDTPGLPPGCRLTQIDSPHNLAQGMDIMLADRPVLLTAAEHPDLLATGECYLVTNLLFEQILDQRTWSSTADTKTLFQAIRQAPEDFGPTERTRFHIRILKPFTDLSLIFIGLPLIIRRDDRNVFRPVLISLTLTGICFGGCWLCQWAGNSMWLAPELAAWIPIIFMAPLATVLYYRMDS